MEKDDQVREGKETTAGEAGFHKARHEVLPSLPCSRATCEGA